MYRFMKLKKLQPLKNFITSQKIEFTGTMKSHIFAIMQFHSSYKLQLFTFTSLPGLWNLSASPLS